MFSQMPLFQHSPPSFTPGVEYRSKTRYNHSRTRVAFLIQLSVPKHEFESALLGIRLLQVVRTAFHRNFPFVIFWTDSYDVLDWIQNQKKRDIFVAHRVDEVSRISAPEDWRFFPSNYESSRPRHKNSETNRLHREMD